MISPSASEKCGETRQIIVPWKNVDSDNWFPSTHDNPWVLDKVLLVNRFLRLQYHVKPARSKWQ